MIICVGMSAASFCDAIWGIQTNLLVYISCIFRIDYNDSEIITIKKATTITSLMPYLQGRLIIVSICRIREYGKLFWFVGLTPVLS